MREMTYQDLVRRYNLSQETIQQLEERLQKLFLENTFIKNEKQMWGKDKENQTKLMVHQINRFNNQIAELNAEIMRLRERIKQLEAEK